MFKRLFVLAALCLLTATLFARPHELERGYLFLRIYDEVVEGRVEVTMEDLATALGLPLSLDSGDIDAALAPFLPQIQAYVTERVYFVVDGQPVRLNITSVEVLEVDDLTEYAVLYFDQGDLLEDRTRIDIHYDMIFEVAPRHKGMVIVEQNWMAGIYENHTTVSLIHDPGSKTQTLDLTDNSMFRGFLATIWLGVEHIAIGIDHILFIIALLLPAVVRRRNDRWEPVQAFRPAMIYVIKVITLFTVAHSVTLSLAALEVVQLPSRLVESIIAASIAVAALDIIFPLFRDKIGWVVFAFGLFHGFGFAGVLGEVGIAPRFLVPTLLGFNIGVELGQVAIICIVFPLLFLMRKAKFYRPVFLRAGALVLIAIALLWFFERAFGFDIDLMRMAKQALGLV